MKDNKLKICFLGEAKSKDVHTLKWMEYFVHRGHIVHVISYAVPDKKIEGIEVHVIRKLVDTNIWFLDKVINMPFVLLRARKIIKMIKPDLIHAHCVVSYGTLGSLLAFSPLIVTAWGSDILKRAPRNIFTKIITKHILKRADLLTCDANHMKEAIVSFGVNSKKVEIIYFGVDVEKFKPAKNKEKEKKKIGFPENTPLIISLRRLKPISDVETLIKAASQVVKKYPQTKFIIAGEGSEKENLKDMAKEMSIRENVIFIGWVDEKKILQYLKSSDIYVSTCLSDGGLASSTAEAMACALPAIITDFGDNRKWVEDGRDGFIIPPKDPEKLANKIIKLLGNKEETRRMGENARKVIETRNNYYKEMEKMENIYYKVSS